MGGDLDGLEDPEIPADLEADNPEQLLRGLPPPDPRHPEDWRQILPYFNGQCLQGADPGICIRWASAALERAERKGGTLYRAAATAVLENYKLWRHLQDEPSWLIWQEKEFSNAQKVAGDRLSTLCTMYEARCAGGLGTSLGHLGLEAPSDEVHLRQDEKSPVPEWNWCAPAETQPGGAVDGFEHAYIFVLLLFAHALGPRFEAEAVRVCK